MVTLLGIKAFHSGVALKHWWEWTLVAISAVSVFIGVVVAIRTSYRSLKRLLSVRLLGIHLARWRLTTAR